MTELKTERLLLRHLRLVDAPRLVELANDFDVAAGVASMPHPYGISDAVAFINRFTPVSDLDTDHLFGICLRSGEIIGVMGLHEIRAYRRAELGYWFGKAYWGQGYATEAAQAVTDWGFTTLPLDRIHAACYAPNIASARIMQKIGMTYEGTQRNHYIRFGVVHDVHNYGILRAEWEQQHSASA
jgi:RimJ/RimL family protein N-acetyltransferase